jgi:DNA-binding transcriptional ArsR family regulator
MSNTLTAFQICPMKPAWVLCCCLKRWACACDLCAALDQSQPKISRHLAMLRESGLLLDRKQGKWVHYRLSPHCLHGRHR